MTTTQKKKILQRITSIEAEIDELKAARKKILTDGYASASMGSGNGSRSYTVLDASKITETISELTSELKSLRAQLGKTDGKLQTSITYTVYF